MEPLKENFIHLIQLLASLEKQDQYQAEVDIDIYDELICMWFDDFYGTEAQQHIISFLNSEEKKYVNEFHDFFLSKESSLPKSYKELRKSQAWERVRKKANDTLTILNWDSIETKSNFRAI